jgi:protein-tyrosine phosphatase
LDDEILSLKTAGAGVLVSLLTPDEVGELELNDEAACCERHGIRFVAFPIIDRSVPNNDHEFLGLVREISSLISSGSAVLIHCRMGIGRSGLLAACVLGSLGQPVDTAFRNIGAARGFPVPDTAEQEIWITSFLARYPDREK